MTTTPLFCVQLDSLDDFVRNLKPYISKLLYVLTLNSGDGDRVKRSASIPVSSAAYLVKQGYFKVISQNHYTRAM